MVGRVGCARHRIGGLTGHPAAAGGLTVAITPQTGGVPGSTALWSAQSTTLDASITVTNGRSETINIVDQTAGQTVATCTGQIACRPSPTGRPT
jgi:hypothetical protein